MTKKKIGIIVGILIIIILVIALIIYFNNRIVLDNSGFTLNDDVSVNVYSEVRVSDFIKDIEGEIVENKSIDKR